MVFRVFYADTYKDVSAQSTSRFSVGSGNGDTVSIPNSNLKKGHVVITLDDSGWHLKSKDSVLIGGKKVLQTDIALGTAIGVSEEDNVSIFLIAALPDRPTTINISDCAEFSVGSADDNGIVLKSRFVSKKHLTIEKNGGKYRLEDRQSTNGTYVNGTRTSGCILNMGDEIILGDVCIMFSGQSLEIYYASELIRANGIHTATRDYSVPVLYKRSPRLRTNCPTRVIDIAPPPSIDGKPEINWLSTLLPAFSTVGIALVMATVLGSVMMLFYSIPMTAVGLILSFANYSKQKKKYTAQGDLRLEKYSEHLNGVIREIERYQLEQLHDLESSDPDIHTCLAIASNLDRRLWQRRATDDDFLSVRLGYGQVPSAVDIHYTKKALSLEEDELATRPQHIYDKYHLVDGAPITCDILHGQVCGIVGQHSDAMTLLNNVLMQIATHHCYTDVKFVFIYDREDENKVGWVKSLPHTFDDEGATCFVATTKLEATELFKSFADSIKSRKYLREAENTYGAPTTMLPYYLFILLQPAFLDKSNPINEYLLRARDLSAGMIMVVDTVAHLPPECNFIIEVNKDKGTVYSKENASLRRQFYVDKAKAENYQIFGQTLSGVTCEIESTSTALPKSLSFYEMLGIKGIDQWDLSAHWAQSNVINTMSAPIGIMESGDILELDIHEKAHGPHGLVAGTTGSGKSEVLISYILSVAMKYHPYEVGFVIIDFKGGGMVNRLEGLPHLIGSITDIDGNGIDRSLASIKAELEKRKRIFAESNLKDNTISEYIDKYKAGLVKTPLPHLVIIVDEFAELKQNQPEFMKEIVSASRIGRSLGIHLILATQQPGGQVSGEIWTNSRFQISLRAASAEDSNEVIRSPLAFSIKEPGRAYVRVGNNEIFEQIQSGYSKVKASSGLFQFEEVLSHISSYCKDHNIAPLPSIYLPALPVRLDYQMQLLPSSCEQGIISCIGMYDAPDQQKQDKLYLNLSTANTVIIGSPQRGKTNLLQTIIRDIAERYSPDQVNLYIADFGSMLLKNFSELKHVGGVVTATEEEKMGNLFKLLTAEIETRRHLFSERGVSSFSAYLEADFHDLPQIVLMIDNFTVMQELYPDESDDLITICREGTAVGVSVVVANSQTGGFGFKYLMNFSSRIALYCNDVGEYSSLFDRSRLTLPNTPGRALSQVDHEIVESQIYLSFDGEKEIDRVNTMRQFVAQCNERHPSSSARKIPVVPERITMANMGEDGYDFSVRNYRVPIGLDYADLGVIYLDLIKQGILGISGAEQYGKTNLIKHIVDAVQSNILDNVTAVYIADGARSLQSLYDLGCVVETTSSTLEAEAMIDSIYEELSARKNTISDGGELSTDAPLMMLVLTGGDMVAQLLQKQAVNDKLQSIAKELKKYKGFVLLDDIENEGINYASPPLMKYMKESHSFIVFDNIASINLFDIPMKLLKTFSKEIRVGDGFIFVGGKVKRVRTILDSQE